MNWPGWLKEYPDSFRLELEQVVRCAKKMKASKDCGYLNSKLVEEAGRIERHSSQLLEMVRIFHEKGSTKTLDDTARKSAIITMISSYTCDFDEAEVQLIEAGVDPHAIQFPLLSLSYHMQAIRSLYSGKSSKSKYIERFVVEYLVKVTTRAGIPLGNKGAKKTKELFDALFYNADIKHPDDRMLSDARKALRNNCE